MKVEILKCCCFEFWWSLYRSSPEAAVIQTTRQVCIGIVAFPADMPNLRYHILLIHTTLPRIRCPSISRFGWLCYPTLNRTVVLYEAVGINRFLSFSGRSPEKTSITAARRLTAKLSGFAFEAYRMLSKVYSAHVMVAIRWKILWITSLWRSQKKLIWVYTVPSEINYIYTSIYFTVYIHIKISAQSQSYQQWGLLSFSRDKVPIRLLRQK